MHEPWAHLQGQTQGATRLTCMSLASVSRPENWRSMALSALPTPAPALTSRAGSSAA